MYIRLWEPPKQKRRLRIQSRTRFILFVVIVLAILAFIIHKTYQPTKEIILDRYLAVKANLDYWLK